MNDAASPALRLGPIRAKGEGKAFHSWMSPDDGQSTSDEIQNQLLHKVTAIEGSDVASSYSVMMFNTEENSQQDLNRL